MNFRTMVLLLTAVMLGLPAVAQQPGVIILPGAVVPRCVAAGNEVCAGCSISCAPGQQASCREGETRGTTCWTKSKCECIGAAPPPPSPVSPGATMGGPTNSCTTPDRFACRGCSATCGGDETAICSPSIPNTANNSCDLPARCRCEKK